MTYSDLMVEVFMVLSKHFYDTNGNPKPYSLRDKLNTQDDPLDEYIHHVLTEEIKNAICEKSSGPLISPDFVIFRPKLCNGVVKEKLRNDLTRIAAVEVKKVERKKGGTVARASGLDYNTSPLVEQFEYMMQIISPWIFAVSIYLFVRNPFLKIQTLIK